MREMRFLPLTSTKKLNFVPHRTLCSFLNFVLHARQTPQLCPRFFGAVDLTPTLYYRYLCYASDMISVENFTHPRILTEKVKIVTIFFLSPQDLLNESTSAMGWNQIQFSPTDGYKLHIPKITTHWVYKTSSLIHPLCCS